MGVVYPIHSWLFFFRFQEGLLLECEPQFLGLGQVCGILCERARMAPDLRSLGQVEGFEQHPDDEVCCDQEGRNNTENDDMRFPDFDWKSEDTCILLDITKLKTVRPSPPTPPSQKERSSVS